MPESEIMGRSSGSGEPVAIGKPDWVITSSSSSPWRDALKVERHVRPAFERPEMAMPMVISLMTGKTRPDSRLELRIAGSLNRALLQPGDVYAISAETPLWVRNLDPTEVIHVCPSSDMLVKVAGDSKAHQQLEFKNLIGMKDQAIRTIATLLDQETRAGSPAGRIYGESLGIALAAHMLHHYAVFPPKQVEPKGGFSRRQLRQLLDYMSANVAADYGIQELANLIELSPFHFCRLFKQSTGCSPHQYILQLRVAEAKRLLRSSQLSIAQIASQVGFFDQSHFTMTFRKLVGTTPAWWRNHC